MQPIQHDGWHPYQEGTMPVNPTVTQLTRALTFTAAAHMNQRRRGAAQEPYINHLIEVLGLVARSTGGDDTELCIAALLHDVIEDTEVTPTQLREATPTIRPDL